MDSRLRRQLLAVPLALWLSFGSAQADSTPGSPLLRKPATNHWAFKSPLRSQPPRTRESGWIRSPIDAFAVARLEKEGWRPSPEADRLTLIRRLSIDLTGLPPTLDEIDAFVSDPARDACERQVERLLSSPHYGERWGRHWLDAARYADSNGFEKDRAREMWHYRDWVIQSLNSDLPYDAFLTHQLAGDLLPNATQDQLIATGFLRNSMINEEGAIDPEQFRMDAMFDRMDCLGKAVLGLTVQCAQCHDHKYDPFSQEDYYRLFAFLNDVDEYTAPIYSQAELLKRDSVHEQLRRLDEETQRALPDWRERLALWENRVRNDQPEWTTPELVEYGDPGGLSKLQPQKNGVLLAGGHRFAGGAWRIRARTTITNIAAVRLEAFANANLPFNGPGRSGNGMFALREFQLKIAPVKTTNAPVDVRFASATADFETSQSPGGPVAKDKDYYGPVRFAIDGNDRTAWTIDAGPGRRNTDRKAVFLASTNFGFVEGTELTFTLTCHDEIACFRISLSTATNAVADPLPRVVRETLATPAERRTPEQQTALFQAWRASEKGLEPQRLKEEAIWKQHPEPSGTTLALQARRDTRPTSILKRGDWLKPDRAVRPGVPGFLRPPLADAQPSRLSLAQWLVDKRSPTTARVFVNRVWQAYFGAGLVATPEDFGVQGDAPSHPELLDWLACEFMTPELENPGRTGGAPAAWSIKHLHRLIVHSSVYRQRSAIAPDAYERDPYNRLLARGARFRVEGETVRDIALAASGLLDPRVGGASVFAPAPAFLFVPPTSFEPFPWQDAAGSDRYRRALYTFRRRSTPYPMLQNFDAPNGDAACVRRARSNTPLQALTSLNETLFVECAQALALRVLSEAPAADADRVRLAFRHAVGRPPTEREQQHLAGLLEREQRHIGEGWISANELATGAHSLPKSLPPGVTPTQLAAYTVLSRVLLNLDETITKE
ncbi:MAG: DUF1549 domain-containing protein [Verrucomicrobia bacterium]|nr:DUF1549 domain-containing protein [Verrucomicrobiota bacterium]